MKKLILSLISCLVITTCFAETNIVMKGEGTSKDYKVAKYLAGQQIEKQYAQLPEKTLKFSALSRIEERPYNYLQIIYTDNIICNFTMQGRNGTGDQGFLQRKVTEWLPCEEERKGDTVKLTCTLNDKIIEDIKQALMNDIPFDTEFCENHFYNEFIDKRSGETTTQRGIIFGKWKYKDYYDRLGKFHTIDYGYDTWYGDHVEKLFYFGNISDDDFYKQQGQLKKMIDEE